MFVCTTKPPQKSHKRLCSLIGGPRQKVENLLSNTIHDKEHNEDVEQVQLLRLILLTSRRVIYVSICSKRPLRQSRCVGLFCHIHWFSLFKVDSMYQTTSRLPSFLFPIEIISRWKERIFQKDRILV